VLPGVAAPEPPFSPDSDLDLRNAEAPKPSGDSARTVPVSNNQIGSAPGSRAPGGLGNGNLGNGGLGGNGRSQGSTSQARNPPPARPPIRRTNSGNTVDITFDDLELEMPVRTLFDKTMLTPRVEELDGQNVRLRGFIFAGGVFQTSGIKSFPFVMNTQCKFGEQGLAYCVILVELVDGVTTDFTIRPITVEGKLSVQPLNASGFTWSVYHLRGTKAY